MKNIEEVLEDMNVRYTINKNDALVEFWTDTAGQDVPVEFEYDGTAEGFVKQFTEKAEDYDVDEEFDLYNEGRGQNGVPNSVRTLLEDIEEAKATLMKIAANLKKAVERR